MLDAEHVLGQIAEVLYTTRATQRHSFDIARDTVQRGIAGDIVECGIAAGGNFASMIVGALSAGGDDRKFWGFDSFQGIQLAGKRDTWQAGIGPITHDVNVPESELLVSSGVTVHSRESVIELLTRWGLWGQADIELIGGWVQHTLPEASRWIGSIAVLRLDMDIYAPTRCALEHLWPKVVPGGVVIIDDWELDGARRAFCEYVSTQGLDYQHLQTPRYPGEDDQGYFVKP